MKTLRALTPEQVDEPTQEVFSAIKQKIGMVPNLFAAMGNSPQLLKGFLAFEDTLKKGVFSAKENEAIALAVSQSNGCNYCLAAHSTMGKMFGEEFKPMLDMAGFSVLHCQESAPIHDSSVCAGRRYLAVCGKRDKRAA